MAYRLYFAPGLAPSSTAVRELPVQMSGEPASFGMAVTVKAAMGDPSGTEGACSVTKTEVAAVESATIVGATKGTPAGGSAGACLHCTLAELGTWPCTAQTSANSTYWGTGVVNLRGGSVEGVVYAFPRLSTIVIERV